MTARLNIRFDSPDWRGKILSNLAPTPFRLGPILFPSVESALQGIKFADPEVRARVFAMNGLSALSAGRTVTNSVGRQPEVFVYWEDQSLPYNSLQHRLLIALFIHEKVRQNPEVQRALLETTGTFIFHDTGYPEPPKTSLPEKFYLEVLLAQRRLLQRLRQL